MRIVNPINMAHHCIGSNAKKRYQRARERRGCDKLPSKLPPPPPPRRTSPHTISRGTRRHDPRARTHGDDTHARLTFIDILQVSICVRRLGRRRRPERRSCRPRRREKNLVGRVSLGEVRLQSRAPPSLLHVPLQRRYHRVIARDGPARERDLPPVHVPVRVAKTLVRKHARHRDDTQREERQDNRGEGVDGGCFVRGNREGMGPDGVVVVAVAVSDARRPVRGRAARRAGGRPRRAPRRVPREGSTRRTGR